MSVVFDLMPSRNRFMKINAGAGLDLFSRQVYIDVHGAPGGIAQSQGEINTFRPGKITPVPTTM